MLDTIIATIPKPPGLPERARRIDVLGRVLDGTLYDRLPYQFSDETGPAGEYVPIRQRKPSVRYNLCRMVVEDSVSMLFGEGRFPEIVAQDDDANAVIADLIDESNLAEVMTEAATRGSVGSIAVLMRLLGKRVFWLTMPTMALTPTWNPAEPDKLLLVTELRQVKGRDIAREYHLDEVAAARDYWFCREWSAEAETWFLPLSVDDKANGKRFVVDHGRTVRHDLGFVPIYWIRNLPGGDDVDGGCTFLSAIETQIEIEYRLSQGGRALQYASDPLMMIRDPARGEGGDMVRSASNAIVVGADGDAKMLEIDGAASAAVVEFCRALRDIAIESVHGNRAAPDKLAAAQSGRAMELLYQPLVNLTDRLRLSYGRAVLGLMRMLLAANVRFALLVNGETILAGSMSAQRLKLRWGPYFPPTLADKQTRTQTLVALKHDGLISRESAVSHVVDFEALDDTDKELARIQADIDAQDARLAQQAGVQIKATEATEA